MIRVVFLVLGRGDRIGGQGVDRMRQEGRVSSGGCHQNLVIGISRREW